MPTLAPPNRRQYRSATLLTVRAATDQELPAGVCGQIEGIALVYDVIDDRGTTFARGCLDRTVKERVKMGKVKLYVDHGDVLLTGMYDTHLHIGTVREVWDDQAADGQFVARFRADIFDTEAGRREHEYMQAVAATKSETGISIGMLDGWKYRTATLGTARCEQITEVPLREISITGEPAVPGTKLTAVRQEANGSADGEAVTPDLDAIAVAAVLRQAASACDLSAAACAYCRPAMEAAALACRTAAKACDAQADGSGQVTEYVRAIADCAAACVAARSISWYCCDNHSQCRAAGALTDTVVSCFRAIAWEVGAGAAASAVRAAIEAIVARSPAIPPATEAVRSAAATAAPPPDGAAAAANLTTVTEGRLEGAPLNYFTLLDGIVAHLGAPAVRTHLGSILSDAPAANSDANASPTRASDSLGAAAGDSQDASRAGSEPATPNVGMDERLAYVRAQFPRLYPQ